MRPQYPQEEATTRVTGLGHVRIHVRDLPRIIAFSGDVRGMAVIKQNWNAVARRSFADRTVHKPASGDWRLLARAGRGGPRPEATG